MAYSCEMIAAAELDMVADTIETYTYEAVDLRGRRKQAPNAPLAYIPRQLAVLVYGAQRRHCLSPDVTQGSTVNPIPRFSNGCGTQRAARITACGSSCMPICLPPPSLSVDRTELVAGDAFPVFIATVDLPQQQDTLQGWVGLRLKPNCPRPKDALWPSRA